jgi:hypothetical protein
MKLIGFLLVVFVAFSCSSPSEDEKKAEYKPYKKTVNIENGGSYYVEDGNFTVYNTTTQYESEQSSKVCALNVNLPDGESEDGRLYNVGDQLKIEFKSNAKQYNYDKIYFRIVLDGLNGNGADLIIERIKNN